ncbi:MAG TPA: DNA recombination protein RmuC, partial [Thermoanaerobaculia bacterium]|nr:DNA recombination protein RmuC [Thermoanaerobaculia bacterium]
MLTTIVVLVAIVAMAGAWVWAQRAIAERDLAVTERSKAETRAVELQRRLDEAQQARAVAESRAQHLESSREQIESTFVALAQRAFQQVGESLVTTSKTQINGSLDTKKAEIDALLIPLREMIEAYRGEVTKSEHVRNEIYGGLQQQIRSLMTAHEAAYREASRLANALQSPTVRGSWGESSLRRCIELSGMSEFCDFTVQETFFDDEGRRRRPDVVVQLPNSRVIAIDAKVPLEDYTHAANETDEARRRDFLGAHAKTLRRHIDSLSKREYQTAISDTLDFVVLFVPGEHFLSAGLISDPTLFDYAADKKIYLASPT